MNVKEILSRFLKRAPDEQRPQAGTRFGISWPLLAALCLVLVCAVGWAFFMGLMVGRGQNPQASIHAATGLMKPEEPVKAAPAALPEPEIETGAPEVPEAMTSAMIAAKTAAQAPAKPATPQKPAVVREAPKKAPARPQQREKSDPGERFDWTFQAGAYKSRTDANEASAKLNRNGLKSTVRKSGKVWLIIISMRGNAADVSAMRQKVRSLKLDRPMQLSKNPIRKRG
ncbi:MAG: SPOR domain-containing protein [Desulfovibrio sp.]|nr:SPOR domain-containing protein [Desulfovibrio sp.]